MHQILVFILVFIASFSAFSQVSEDPIQNVFDHVANNEPLAFQDKKILTDILFSYIDEPTIEKETELKTYLKFESRLQSSPLSGVKDGIVDHMRRITEGLGIVGDFAEPVLGLVQSLEKEVINVINTGAYEIGMDGVKPQDLKNIAEIAGKVILYKVDSEARSKPGTVITVSGSNKQYLLDYLFALDLLKLSESTNSELYELALLRALASYGNISRQIQGLKYSIFGTFALVDWSYLLAERHQALKFKDQYFKQVSSMIKNNQKKNPYKREWKKTLGWMKKILRRTKSEYGFRPLTTIFSSGILVAEMKLSLLYAKINTFIVTSKFFNNDMSWFQRKFHNVVIIPELQASMRVPAYMLGGALKIIYRLGSRGDQLISQVHKGLKPHYDFCRYHYRNWFETFRRNIY